MSELSYKHKNKKYVRSFMLVVTAPLYYNTWLKVFRQFPIFLMPLKIVLGCLLLFVCFQTEIVLAVLLAFVN